MSCRSSDRSALADTGGRMSMPFLPTLATVVVLAAASVFCPKGQAPSPGAAARMIPATGAPSLAMAEPVAPAPERVPRLPAVVAFGELYPLTVLPAEPTTTAAIPAPAAPATRAASAARPQRRLTATGRRSCTGHHCPDNPLAAAKSSVDSPFAAAKPSANPATETAEADTPASVSPSSPVPSALPFTDTVAEAVVPVARKVGAGLGAQIEGLGARVDQITGTAGDLVRGGRSVVKGSVAALTDSLL